MRSTVQRLLEIVDRFGGRRIVVAGDLVADEFLYGDIQRVSREAPVLILRHQQTTVVPGAAGNTAANLRALGARPVPVGLVGKDAAGGRLQEALSEAGISRSGLLAPRNYETPTKRRILAGGVHTRRQQIVRVDRGALPGALEKSILQALGKKLDRALLKAEALLIADYGYGAAAPEQLNRRIAQSRRNGRVVTVDSRERVAAFRGADSCTPNQEELECAAERGPLAAGEIASAARGLMRRCGHRGMLVTRGAQGMDWVQSGRRTARIPAFGSEEVADVTGAGDTVIAVFTLALVCGADAVDAARLANCAAGLVVAKAGTATIDRNELRAALNETESMP